MRKSVLGVMAMLLAAPVHADTPRPAWEGVWRGTIGTLPVLACLAQRSDSWNMGSYYYLNKLTPIPLNRETDGSWTEHGGSGEVTGKWTLGVGAGGRLSGQWKAGAKDLPVSLTRVAAAASDDGPCASDAFFAPRVRPVRQSTKPARKDGFAYTEVTYNVGPSFPDVSLSSFSYPEAQPGDRAINAFLRLNPAKPGDPAEYLPCLQSSLASTGSDSEFAFSYTPGLVTRDFVSVAVDSGGTCGGAHPDEAQWHITLDRQTGRKIDLASWFTRAGFLPRSPNEGGEIRQIMPALRRLVLSRFRFAEAECREAVAMEDYWAIGIARGGIAFQPNLPHVAAACADSAVVPFAALNPFLSPVGKQGAAKLAGR